MYHYKNINNYYFKQQIIKYVITNKNMEKIYLLSLYIFKGFFKLFSPGCSRRDNSIFLSVF